MASPTKSPGRAARKQSRAAEERRRLRERFFSRLDFLDALRPLEHLSGALYFVKDIRGRIMTISYEAARLLGFSSAEALIGIDPRKLLPGRPAIETVSTDARVFRQGRPLLNVPELWVTASGAREWIVLDKFPLRDRQGRVTGLMGVLRGFDEQREMLGQLGPAGKAAEYIQDRLGDRLLLAGIARAAGSSERQLQRLFQRAFGMSVQQFVRQARIHAGMRELTASRRSIAEIAAALGFSDQSAFTNAFRRFTGAAPGAFREAHLARMSTRVSGGYKRRV